jgi:hypothetical protein
MDLTVAAEDPDMRRAIGSLLAVRFGEGTPTLVATEDKVWAATAGRSDWIALWEARDPPARIVGHWGTRIGLGTAILGGIGAAIAYTGATQAAADIGAANSEASFSDADGRYRRFSSAFHASTRVGAVGLGIAGVGVVLLVGAPER